MKIKPLQETFAVCQLPLEAAVDLSRTCTFASRTDEELSLVCPAAAVPDCTLAREDGWRAFRIEGVLDFSLVGILARISTLLAQQQIGLFAVSTFNTDYILVKEQAFEQALKTLEQNGYEVLR